MLLVFASLAMAQSKPYSPKPQRSASDLRAERALKLDSKGTVHHSSSAVAPPSTLKTTPVDQQLNRLEKKDMASAKDSAKKSSHPTYVTKLPKENDANKPVEFAYKKPKGGVTTTNTATSGSRSRGSGLHGRVNPHAR